MKLFHRDLGGSGKPPLVILHGFLGSSRNWQTAGRELAADFHTQALDLRNHGQSPHDPDGSLGAMAADVIEWLDASGIARTHLLGHSLGGKVAMRIACSRPERIESLIVVDIAPREYPGGSAMAEAMARLDLSTIASRQEADEMLEAAVPDRATRQFLLTNLQRREDGSFEWQANLPALLAALPELKKSPLAPRDRFEGRALFLRGGRSGFVRPEDESLIRGHFHRAEIAAIDGAGHNLHIDERLAFAAEIRRFAGGR